MSEQTHKTAAQLQAEYDELATLCRDFDQFTREWDRQNQKDRMAALDERGRERADLIRRKGEVTKLLTAAQIAEREAAALAPITE
jgi:hypothetical protein